MNNLLLLRLHVVENHGKGSALLTEISDNGARAANNLAGSAVRVALGKTAPLTELSASINLNKRYVTLLAKGTHELYVLVIVAILSKESQTTSASVEGFGAPIL